MKMKIGSLAGLFGLFVTLGLLSACGGSGGGSSAPATVSGIFANVSGMGYSSATTSGTTGAKGTFSYVAGNTVKFTVGDIVIGQDSGGSLITPLNLVPGADAATPKVVNVMRFMMSIGSYDPANLTIAIPAAVANTAKGKTFDCASATDADLLSMVRLLTGNNNAALVEAATASDFLSKVIYKYYGGTYRGSFTGPASSQTWEMTINTTDGVVTGAGLDGDKEPLDGSMANGVNFTAAARGGCKLSGKLNIITGEFSGNWEYALIPGKIGTFTGTKSAQ